MASEPSARPEPAATSEAARAPSHAAAAARPATRALLAEQLEPLAALQQRLATLVAPTVDAAAARARLAAGLVAYDAHAVCAAANRLDEAFRLALGALERAGLVTSEDAAWAGDASPNAWRLVEGWLSREPLPSHAVRAATWRACGLVARAILRRASSRVVSERFVQRWSRPSCPCCGGPAEFAFGAVRGGRTLACAWCDTQWPSPTGEGCVGCGARASPEVVRLHVAEVRCTLMLCNACGRYLKEPDGPPPADLLLERHLTEELDAAAERRGLRL